MLQILFFSHVEKNVKFSSLKEMTKSYPKLITLFSWKKSESWLITDPLRNGTTIKPRNGLNVYASERIFFLKLGEYEILEKIETQNTDTERRIQTAKRKRIC